MQLYFDPRTVNCRKVVAGFKLMGIDYETMDIDYFTQGQQAPEYMAINPNASLPSLVDGDLKLWDVGTRKELASFSPRSGKLRGQPRIAFSPDGQRLAVTGMGVHFLDVEEFQTSFRSEEGNR